jgi:hypothetical protein
MAVRRLWPFWVWGEAGEGFVALRVLRECELLIMLVLASYFLS